MTLHESCTTSIFTGHPNGSALHQNRPERQQLTESPVDVAFTRHLLTLFVKLFDLGVHGEALGVIHVCVADSFHYIPRNG